MSDQGRIIQMNIRQLKQGTLPKKITRTLIFHASWDTGPRTWAQYNIPNA